MASKYIEQNTKHCYSQEMSQHYVISRALPVQQYKTTRSGGNGHQYYQVRFGMLVSACPYLPDQFPSDFYVVQELKRTNSKHKSRNKKDVKQSFLM